MKALTLTQPWATLVAIGAKRYETRGWQTPYRGLLAIHAGKGLAPVGGMRGLRDLCATEPFRQALNEAGFADPADLPRGVIVATCILDDCTPTDQLTNGMLGTWERAFGDYSPGRYGWRLRGVEPTPLITATGRLGLWDFSPSTYRAGSVGA